MFFCDCFVLYGRMREDNQNVRNPLAVNGKIQEGKVPLASYSKAFRMLLSDGLEKTIISGILQKEGVQSCKFRIPRIALRRFNTALSPL